MSPTRARRPRRCWSASSATRAKGRTAQQRLGQPAQHGRRTSPAPTSAAPSPPTSPPRSPILATCCSRRRAMPSDRRAARRRCCSSYRKGEVTSTKADGPAGALFPRWSNDACASRKSTTTTTSSSPARRRGLRPRAPEFARRLRRRRSDFDFSARPASRPSRLPAATGQTRVAAGRRADAHPPGRLHAAAEAAFGEAAGAARSPSTPSANRTPGRRPRPSFRPTGGCRSHHRGHKSGGLAAAWPSTKSSRRRR